MGQSGRLILIDLKMRCPGSSPTSDWYAHTHWYIPPSGFRSCEKKKRNGKLSLSTKRKNESVSSCFCLQVIFQSVALVSDVNDWAKWNKAPPPCEREREKKELIFFFFPFDCLRRRKSWNSSMIFHIRCALRGSVCSSSPSYKSWLIPTLAPSRLSRRYYLRSARKTGKGG